MRDVAASAGVSVQTVSNFVNNRFHLMTDATRARVEQAMGMLGYHPNATARSLRSQRTNTLAFLVLDEGARFLADPMTDLIMAGIGDVVRDRGYGVLIRAARPDAPTMQPLTPLLENRVDGAFLFLSGDPDVRRWYVSRTVDLGFPFVVFEDPAWGPSAVSVAAANRDGARGLAEHLIAKGHRRIGFLAARAHWPMVEERYQGYLEALKAAGLEADASLERFDGVWEARCGEEMADALLSASERPSAVMCGNDLLALGAIRAARRRGLRVPEDVAVTGFDDFDFAEFVHPPLTTVRVPGYEMGRVAAESLLQLLQGKPVAERRIVLPVVPCLRESA
jgi:DNA-binding LacI/PurR family transcriptional regulator